MKKLTADQLVRRKYNALYRARKKGYKIDINERTIYRGSIIDTDAEKILSEYDYHVQLNLFENERNTR